MAKAVQRATDSDKAMIFFIVELPFEYVRYAVREKRESPVNEEVSEGPSNLIILNVSLLKKVSENI
ncbi:hypothetical protein GCM10008933_25870 [Paenibacillus motobuensis]|uniref:Uncharacterized protein n=1 Tax=Paenibacillus motobuensis TaxID=295324 RepID=A0ABN0YFH4_9BACL